MNADHAFSNIISAEHGRFHSAFERVSETLFFGYVLDPQELPKRFVVEILLDGVPMLSPLAWPLAYAWPVHRIGPDHRPDAPPSAPTLLLVRREHDGQVRFSELSPLAFRLLQRLDESPGLSGRAQLEALAREAGSHDTDAFIEHGGPLLSQMHAANVILGVAPNA